MGSLYLSKTDESTMESRLPLNGHVELHSNQNWEENVFNIRERLENKRCGKCTLTQKLPTGLGDPSVFVLPSSPQSIIAYEYVFLAGATSRGDFGFDTLRKLEGKDFYFDFWGSLFVKPGQHLINRLHHFFLETNVKLVMDNMHRILVAPKLEQKISNKLSYQIEGSTGLTEIVLQDGLNFVLKSSTTSIVSFLLDSRFMPQPATLGAEKKILLGETVIDYSALPKESRIWIRNKEEVSHLNLTTNTITIASVAQRRIYSLEGLKPQLEQLASEHRATERFVAIGGKVDGYTAYDTIEHMFVYTNDPTPSDTHILAVQSQEFGCFVSPSQCRVWCTNLKTHNAIVETKSFCNDGSEFKVGNFFLVSEKRAVIEIVSADSLSMTELRSRRYRYLLSETECLLLDIKRFAPDNNISEDVHFALKAAPQPRDAQTHIGNNKHPIVSVKNADWVSYDRLRVSGEGESSTAIVVVRSWYSASAQTTIDLQTSQMPDSVLLRNLNFFPLAVPSVSSGKKEVEVIFHDESSAQVFRYKPPESGSSDPLEVIRRDVVNVTRSGATTIGVTTQACVVEFLSSQQVRIIGYNLDFLLNQIHLEDWWDSLDIEDKTLAPAIPFYLVEPGQIKTTRSWYLSETNVYVIVDQYFKERDTINCVGVTASANEALLVTGDGMMWIVKVFRVNEIEVDKHADGLRPKKGPKPTPEEWSPSRTHLGSVKIIDAQWAVDGTTIETQEGLVIRALNLTKTSAEFTLRSIRVQGNGNAEAAKQAYRQALALNVQMPLENFLPVWLNNQQGYLFNVRDQANVRVIIPSHQSAPLGVNDIEDKMVFFNSDKSQLWSDDTELPSTFDVAVRYGEVLVAESSQEIAIVGIPKLYGVKVISMILNAGVQKLIIPDEVNEVTVDTTDMVGTDIEIIVEVPWSVSIIAQIRRESNDVGTKKRDTIFKDVRRAQSGETLRWHKLDGQTLLIMPRSHDAARSAATEDDGSWGVLAPSLIGAAFAAVIIGVVAFLTYKKMMVTTRRQLPQE
eukprot:GEMP01011405.1.p1 GENE.GEMP01011405.1~~GEMP01011405.1.p1  ORF type:complete len:1065 (+),score=81.47 GEMP01011405.1:133-3195(+)